MPRSSQRRNVRGGAAGGAANEAGSSLRSGVAAYIATHILRGQPFADLDLSAISAVPVSMRLEANEAVDDLVVEFASGGTGYLQVKTSLDFGRAAATSMDDVIDQWVELTKEKQLDPTTDRLVAVGARGSGAVRDLQRALQRRRRPVAESPSRAQEDALELLVKRLGEMEAARRDALLDCAVMWLADLEEADGLSARLGQALLEPAVVVRDQGAAAWVALRDGARDLARKRYGATLDDLIEQLSSSGVTLTADGEGYASAQRRDRAQKIEAYRERVKRRGETLDLRGLGTPLPPFQLSDIEAGVRVSPTHDPAAAEPGSESIGGRDLTWALRRRGRALLIGLPGAGKSVALRATAGEYAERPDWPLPLVVPLDRLTRLSQMMSFDDALLDAAFEMEPLEERSQLRVAAIAALREGSAALFLDALDETRSQRHAIVRAIAEKVTQFDPAVEILLSTRHAAYADAHTLGFPELYVQPPDHPEHAVRPILEAVRHQRHPGSALDDGWVTERVDWVTTRLSTDAGLRETPLIVVLLTMLTAEHDLEDLPGDRAHVLARVLDDVVTRWDAGVRLRGDQPQLGSLVGPDALNAARMAFHLIGHQLFEETDPRREDVVAQLAQALIDPFGVALARASGIAEDATGLWDEVGVFVISGSTGRLQPRLRMFAELAEATQVASSAPELQRAWTAASTPDPDAREAVLLAAGLNLIVADELISVAIGLEQLGPVELVADAARAGVVFSPERLAELIDAMVSCEREEDYLFQLAELLLRLPLGGELTTAALDVFDRLSDVRRILLRAIAVARWSRCDALVGEDLKAITTVDPTVRVSLREPPFSFAADPIYQQAVIAAAEQIDAAGFAEIAPWLKERMSIGVAIGAVPTIRHQLVSRGYAGLLEDPQEERDNAAVMEQFRQGQERDRETERLLLEQIGELAAVEPLGRVESRRMDALADLITTSELGKSMPAELSGGVRRDGERMKATLTAAALIGGVQPGTVAAEAKQLLQEASDDPAASFPLVFLWDAAKKLPRRNWDRVPDPALTAAVMADALVSPYSWIAMLAFGCLEVSPVSARQAAIDVIDARLDAAPARCQWLAAVARLWLAGGSGDMLDRYQTHPQPMIRRATATFLSLGAPVTEGLQQRLIALLQDCDGGVRDEAISSISARGLDDTLADSIAASAELPTQWQCFWCGRINVVSAEKCQQCNLSGPHRPIRDRG